MTGFLGSGELAKKFNLPRWFLYVPLFYFGLILVSTAHFVEHIYAMIQKYVLNEPPWGVIGQVADREWLHVWYNVPLYLAILFAYIIVRRGIPDAQKRDSGLSTLALFLAIQGYHVLEHVVKLYQYLTGGVEPTPGILGNWIDLVPLHFGLVFVTYALMVLVFFRSELFGYPRLISAFRGVLRMGKTG